MPGATVKVPPKEYPLGQRAGPAMTPVPLRLIDCGDPGALSTIFSAALRVPAAVAVKPILITHEAFDSTDAGQVLVWVKSPGFAPPIEIELIVSAVEPLLLTVMVCVADGTLRL